MTVAADETVAERLERDIRVAMAKCPKPERSRGWLTARARQDALEWLDCLLDEWNLLTKP